MIHAYNESYLSRAGKTMGSLFDAGLMTMPPEKFTRLFLASRISHAWEKGNPSYIAGKSGEELLEEITGQKVQSAEYSYDRSGDYWCGYVLCYAQWQFGCSFDALLSVMSLEELRQLYPTLHEADISKVLDIIHKRLYPESALKTWRQKRKLSQSQLAKISGVTLRSIQAYEQGDLDISKAQYDTLARLADTLSCPVHDLIS
jgi:DNA-binding transcriptional regulator YiaG